MPFEMFCIEIPGGQDELVRLNHFISAHQVVSKRQQLVEREGIPYMMLWLEYTSSQSGMENPAKQQEPKTDVWQTLNPTQRNVFEHLREVRNKIAEEEHVKPYIVFTNDQLGEMVKRRVSSLAEMKEIRDVGKSRLERYGARMLEVFKEAFAGKPEGNLDEAEAQADGTDGQEKTASEQ